jgi:hypothetical protein
LEDQSVNGRLESKWNLGRLIRGVWSGFTWLRIGTVGGLLWMRWWTFGFCRHGVCLFPSTSVHATRGLVFRTVIIDQWVPNCGSLAALALTKLSD